MIVLKECDLSDRSNLNETCYYTKLFSIIHCGNIASLFLSFYSKLNNIIFFLFTNESASKFQLPSLFLSQEFYLAFVSFTHVITVFLRLKSRISSLIFLKVTLSKMSHLTPSWVYVFCQFVQTLAPYTSRNDSLFQSSDKRR